MNASQIYSEHTGDRIVEVYKRIRRLVMVPCSNCLGSGNISAKGTQKKCPECNGKGEVEKWVVEIVNDDE